MISDNHFGLKATATRIFHGYSRQHYQAHFLRNLFSHISQRPTTE